MPDPRISADLVAGSAYPHRLARLGLLRDLDHTRLVFVMLTPNWFASVMGTGIVAIAATRLPIRINGLHDLAIGTWALGAIMLLVLTVATVAHWVLYPENARSHANNSIMVHFYGAPPMATLTIGAGTLLVGSDIIGQRVAIDIDWTLWLAGTLTGLFAAAVIPYLTFTRHLDRSDTAFGGWLMPVVPPMVSASTGALLLPYAAPGQCRVDLLCCCYVMFGLSLIASMVVITLIWYRLAVHGMGEARMVPTLWIVLGPLGQSITAANLLGANAHLAVPVTEANVLRILGVVYGLPVLGFAVLWGAIATASTLRTARNGLPFSLTWWSFTFPVGACVTGISVLAVATGSGMLRIGAVLLFVVLLASWLTVAARTARGSIRGELFLPIGPTHLDVGRRASTVKV